MRLQGAGKFVLSLYNHVKAFQKQLESLQKQLKTEHLSHFTSKKLIEEDRNVNEALLLLRFEKCTNMFGNVKQKF